MQPLSVTLFINSFSLFAAAAESKIPHWHWGEGEVGTAVACQDADASPAAHCCPVHTPSAHGFPLLAPFVWLVMIGSTRCLFQKSEAEVRVGLGLGDCV